MKRAYLVLGLSYGDEGKGSTVDYLAHKFDAGLVVRYNGGSQAGHNVVTPDGRHHTFQQFGAGMFHPNCMTHLSRFMICNPMNMMEEEKHLREVGITDAWKRTTVDMQTLIATPFHRELNRVTTPQGTNSCGQGIGVCRDMHLTYGDKVLFAGDLYNEEATRKKLRFICDRVIERVQASDNYICGQSLPADNILCQPDATDLCWNWYKNWREYLRLVPTSYVQWLVNDAGTVIFEGAQGVLLDEKHGEPGYNTWTDCTFGNAERLLNEIGYTGRRIRVGVSRTYHTRHGAGPLPTEDPSLNYPEPHNEAGYQGNFRRGVFDYDLFSKALTVCGGVDWLALNHIDQHNLVAGSTYLGGVRIGIEGCGPTHADRMGCFDESK